MLRPSSRKTLRKARTNVALADLLERNLDEHPRRKHCRQLYRAFFKRSRESRAKEAAKVVGALQANEDPCKVLRHIISVLRAPDGVRRKRAGTRKPPS
jgi:hypothetical protein